MTSISYQYVAPFVVEDGDGVERERVPVEVYSKKWRHLSGTLYRVWFRLVVTEFGAALAADTLDEERVTYPDWFDAEGARTIKKWVGGIRAAALPAAAIDEAIGDEALTRVEEMTAAGESELDVTVRLNAPALPMTAEVGPATATFDPGGGN